jgi:hypothetical protein
MSDRPTPEPKCPSCGEPRKSSNTRALVCSDGYHPRLPADPEPELNVEAEQARTLTNQVVTGRQCNCYDSGANDIPCPIHGTSLSCVCGHKFYDHLDTGRCNYTLCDCKRPQDSVEAWGRKYQVRTDIASSEECLAELRTLIQQVSDQRVREFSERVLEEEYLVSFTGFDDGVYVVESTHIKAVLADYLSHKEARDAE